jgi:hypothetical protein
MFKKKIFFCVAGAVILGVIIFFAMPLSFGGLFDNIAPDSEVLIFVRETYAEFYGNVTMPRSVNSEYVINSESREFAQIMEILSNYSYRRFMRTFFGDTSMMGNNAGFWLSIYAGEIGTGEITGIISGGTREIVINNRVYRMSSARNTAMMNEIKNILREE